MKLKADFFKSNKIDKPWARPKVWVDAAEVCEKIFNVINHLGKPEWDNTTHSLQWLQLKQLTTLMKM